MENCFNELASSSISSEGGSEYEPFSTDEEQDVAKKKQFKKVALEQRLFVCETSQLVKFVNQINESSRCSTSNCHSELYIHSSFISIFFSPFFFSACAYVER